MSMTKQEVVDAVRVLISIIESKFKSAEVVYDLPMNGSGKGSYTADEIVGHAKVVVREFEKSDDDVSEPAKEVIDLWSRMVELVSSKCAVLQFARAPGDQNLYLDVTDRWTGDEKVTFFAPTIAEIVKKATEKRRSVISSADKKNVNLR